MTTYYFGNQALFDQVNANGYERKEDGQRLTGWVSQSEETQLGRQSSVSNQATNVVDAQRKDERKWKAHKLYYWLGSVAAFFIIMKQIKA